MKRSDESERDLAEAKARMRSFNDFNFMLLGVTALIGAGCILLRMLGYDVTAIF